MVRWRRLSITAAAGLLAACGLSLSAGAARAAPAGRAGTQLTPGPAEWWFAGWQVQRTVWPLTEGAGVTVAEVGSGVQASLPDLHGVVLPGANLTGSGGNGDTDIQIGEDGHGTAMAVVIAGQGTGTGTVGIAPKARILPVTVGGSGPREPYVAVAAPGDHMVYVGRDGRYTTTGAGTSFSAALTAAAAALIRSRYPDMPWYQVDQRLIGTATPAGRRVPNTGYGYGIVNLARAVNAQSYPVPAAAANPVYASFSRWLATAAGRVAAARDGLGARDPGTPAARDPGTPAARSARGDSARTPSITVPEIMITAVAAVCAFVAALMFVLRMSSRRRRRAAMAASARLRWDERPWSFGPEESDDYSEVPGYGRPPGYGPPPLWTEPPYDPPGR